jgi:Putative DNA-binding domain
VHGSITVHHDTSSFRGSVRGTKQSQDILRNTYDRKWEFEFIKTFILVQTIPRMNTQFDFFSGMTENDLVSYFQDGQEESERLEFKSGKSSFSKLYREICAFANTDGGILILGTPTEVEIQESKVGKEKRKTCKGELIPSLEDKTEDSVIQMIQTGITPIIAEIKVKKITCHDGFAYIFFISKSKNSPHQVDGTYYIRVGTMSQPAPHGIVEALFNKRNPVDLEFHVVAKGDPIEDSYATNVELAVNVTNKSDYPAHGVEGFVMLVGDIRHFDKRPEGKMVEELLLSGKCRYKKHLSFPGSLLLDLWQYFSVYQLTLVKEYFYLQVYIWAKDIPGIYKLYKIEKTGNIIEIDPSNQLGKEELRAWVTPTDY